MKKLLAIILLIVSFVVLSGCDNPVQYRSIKSCILSSQIEKESSGIFILGFGRYESSQETITKYYFYVLGDEGYRLQKIDSNNVEIVEDDSMSPCIKGQFELNGKISEYLDYVIYVPTGTITQEYSADLDIN